MVLNWVPFTEMIDGAAESAQQDQTARMCSLILLYPLCKINSWSKTAGYRLKHVGVWLRFAHFAESQFNTRRGFDKMCTCWVKPL